ncbi:MAG: hypothetical protein JXL84_15140 [Deltaproteobacteria bacterium]|nr:hypothetical protein [Deltaproteobacteria bacterium]
MSKFTGRKAGCTLLGILVCFAITAFIIAGLTGPAMGASKSDNRGLHWKQKWSYFSGTASETISLGDALTMNVVTGEIGKADADSGTSAFLIGFAGNGASYGQSVQVVMKGILSGISEILGHGKNTGLTPYGAPVFLSTDAGGVTTWANLVKHLGTGATVYAGRVMQRSEWAVGAGVVHGSDTILIDVSPASGASPYFPGYALP